MPHDVISTCPVCSHELSVTRLNCGECGTTLEGSFSVGRFGRLNRDQLSLLESFLRSRGNLREMERELGLSYPTIRGRVDAWYGRSGSGTRRSPQRRVTPPRHPSRARQPTHGGRSWSASRDERSVRKTRPSRFARLARESAHTGHTGELR